MTPKIESPLFLVLNLGFHNIRAIVFNSAGEVVQKANRPVQTYLLGDGVEQDPEAWLFLARELIAEVTANILIRNRIKYLTVTSSASCLVVTDQKNVPLSNALMVADKRSHMEAKEIAAMAEYAPVFEQSGVSADPSQIVPKIIWWRKNYEALVRSNTLRFMSPNDFFTCYFTGQYVTDPYNAQKSFFDCTKFEYPLDLFAKLGIDVDRMPRVETAGTIVGPILREIARDLGLPEDCTFILSTYDAICGFWGSGPDAEGDACDVSGTVTSLRVLAPAWVRGMKVADLFISPTDERDLVIFGGSNNLGGGLVEWAKGTFYKDSIGAYQTMESEARDSLLGAKGLLFLPYLMGERAPIWDKDARGVLFGLERFHRRSDIARSIFESIGFSLYSLVEKIESHGVEITRIRASGGLARINFVSQIKADVTGKEILLVDDLETAGLGAFIVMGATVGLFESLRCGASKVSSIREIIRPNMKRHQEYKLIYCLFKQVYSSLKPSFAARSELMRTLYNGSLSTEEIL